LADASIAKLGSQHAADRPPDQLPAIITTAVEVGRKLELLGGTSSAFAQAGGWAATVRDYYLDQLKTYHDYRAFPVLLTLERTEQLLGDAGKLDAIMAAMTFRVTTDANFQMQGTAAGSDISQAQVAEQASVSKYQWTLSGAQPHLPLTWNYTGGSLTCVSHGTGICPDGQTYSLVPGQSFQATLVMYHWDACVSQRVYLGVDGGFAGPANYSGWPLNPDGWAAGAVGLALQPFLGTKGYDFPVSIQNRSATLGDQTFPGNFTAGPVTDSGQVHFIVTHTPQ
jgi:hypothetical protein